MQPDPPDSLTLLIGLQVAHVSALNCNHFIRRAMCWSDQRRFGKPSVQSHDGKKASNVKKKTYSLFYACCARCSCTPQPLLTNHESTSLPYALGSIAMQLLVLLLTPTTAHESTSLTSRAWLHRNAAPSALAHANHGSRVDFTDPTRLALLQFCAQCSSYSNQCSRDEFTVFTNLLASFLVSALYVSLHA